MSNKYFDGPATPDEHPRVRLWRAHRARPEVTGMSVEIRRPKASFGYGTARIYVDFLDSAGTTLHQDEVEWDWALDTWLLGEGVRAHKPENESLRMSLRLRRGFQPLQRSVGDGQFNSLLAHVVRAGPFASNDGLRTLLSRVLENPPLDGGRLNDRVEQIEGVFKQSAHELTDKLNYGRPEAEEILASALAMYLDERFRVSERLQLFGG